MPTITIEVPEAIEVEVRKHAFKMEPGKFCQAGHLKVYMYGLGRFPNDRAGAAGKREEYDSDDAFRDALLAHAHKAVDGLITGNLRAERVGKPRDPVMAEAMAMAKAVLINAEVKKGATEAVARKRVAALDGKKVDDWCRDYLERNPEKLEAARKIVEARAESVADADDDFDLDSLMADPAPDVAEAA